jgi:aryl-alcohol dehydrogenase-like predicted oxidoreductase
LNQRAITIVERAKLNGFGIIARMPLQFGLLTGKFNKFSKFEKNDHRSFRLNEHIIETTLNELENIWFLTEKYNTNKTGLSLSFIAAISGINTIIPGIKTEIQAVDNCTNLVQLENKDIT